MRTLNACSITFCDTRSTVYGSLGWGCGRETPVVAHERPLDIWFAHASRDRLLRRMGGC